MKSGSQDKVEGNLREAGGAIKQKVGEALNDKDMAADGAAKRAQGKVQDKVGDVKKVFNR